MNGACCSRNPPVLDHGQEGDDELRIKRGAHRGNILSVKLMPYQAFHLFHKCFARHVSDMTSLAADSPFPRIAGGPHAPRNLGLLLGALACLALPVPGFVALLLGALLAWGHDVPTFVPRAGKQLLMASVVALGAGTRLDVLLKTGLSGLGTALITLTVAFAAGLLLARWLRIERDVALLITVGTAICGGSAIAAAAPALRARPSSVGVALGVVFLLNAIALFVFPWLGQALGLDAQAFGEWCALAIHDTSSVVGAAATHGDGALEVATVTKLARSLWILPVCLALSFVPARGIETGKRRAFPRPPLFVLAFVALAALVALVPALEEPGRLLAAGGRRCLVLALFSMGLSLTPASLRAASGRILVLGLSLWLLLGGVALALVLR